MEKENKIRLVLPLPVSLNKLYINQYKYNPKTRKREPTGAKILSQEGLASKMQIRKYAKKQMKEYEDWDMDYTIENFIYIDVDIYFNRKGRDDDNCYKLLKDSLQDIIYHNDSRALVRTNKILFDYDNPRLELTIYPVTYIGIFDDKSDLDKFESVCKTCKRYKNNCSILRKAKEGIVQEEIVTNNNNKSCAKYNEI